jgi:hypothetical protein
MTDELLGQLQQARFDVQPEVFVFGFSIGGHFANRYALLHPERVKAFAAGGLSGEITLPIPSHGGYPLDWYLGIHGLAALTGEAFKENAYRQVPQFYFWGDEDLYPYHLGEKCEHWGEEYCHWVEVWGDEAAEALRNQCTFLQGLGYKEVSCNEYVGIGHIWTEQMVTAMSAFFNRYRYGNIIHLPLVLKQD